VLFGPERRVQEPETIRAAGGVPQSETTSPETGGALE
jgi:hypothetical protein